jgi:ribonuclease HII
MSKIVGIDEVGRGPLAGPVTVCLVSCDLKTYAILKRNKNLPPLGKDSKKLTHEDREKYNKVLRALAKEGKIKFAILHQSNKLIDSKGISFCIKKSVSGGLEKLRLSPQNTKVLLDGGLKAPLQFKNQKTIIKGDEKERIIAWASILAKVSRDALMVKIAKKYSKYGFESHKGYGTIEHRKVISKLGLTVLHRQTFCTRISQG